MSCKHLVRRVSVKKTASGFIPCSVFRRLLTVLVTHRATAKTTGERIGVVGYVCNLPDGSVELVAQGTHRQVKDMKAWCHVGPPMAVVASVDEISPMAEVEALEYQQFQVRRETTS